MLSATRGDLAIMCSGNSTVFHILRLRLLTAYHPRTFEAAGPSVWQVVTKDDDVPFASHGDAQLAQILRPLLRRNWCERGLKTPD